MRRLLRRGTRSRASPGPAEASQAGPGEHEYEPVPQADGSSEEDPGAAAAARSPVEHEGLSEVPNPRPTPRLGRRELSTAPSAAQGNCVDLATGALLVALALGSVLFSESWAMARRHRTPYRAWHDAGAARDGIVWPATSADRGSANVTSNVTAPPAADGSVVVEEGTNASMSSVGTTAAPMAAEEGAGASTSADSAKASASTTATTVKVAPEEHIAAEEGTAAAAPSAGTTKVPVAAEEGPGTSTSADDARAVARESDEEAPECNEDECPILLAPWQPGADYADEFGQGCPPPRIRSRAEGGCVCPPSFRPDGNGSCRFPPGPESMTFYVYRAQSDAEYSLESINVANLPGVLYYLHHEVVPWAEGRHYNVTRIMRLKLTVKSTREVFEGDPLRPSQFMSFMALNFCLCPSEDCDPIWARFGFAPGIQRVTSTLDGDYLYPYGLWYSLPGACMSLPCDEHSQECRDREPGGRCETPDGSRTCTWHLERAGEVSLDELEGIQDHEEFRRAGGREYVPELDRGVMMDFWDGRRDADRCRARVRALQKLFRDQYPGMRASYPDPVAV